MEKWVHGGALREVSERAEVRNEAGTIGEALQ